MRFCRYIFMKDIYENMDICHQMRQENLPFFFFFYNFRFQYHHPLLVAHAVFTMKTLSIGQKWDKILRQPECYSRVTTVRCRRLLYTTNAGKPSGKIRIQNALRWMEHVCDFWPTDLPRLVSNGLRLRKDKNERKSERFIHEPRTQWTLTWSVGRESSY